MGCGGAARNPRLLGGQPGLVDPALLQPPISGGSGYGQESVLRPSSILVRRDSLPTSPFERPTPDFSVVFRLDLPGEQTRHRIAW